jgi:hypothetical protein
MTLLNDQRKRANQTVQQIKDLARAGEWVEAKRLADTLPKTPDNTRLQERIAKQLFIATGEVPSVMEGSLALFDADSDVAAASAVPTPAAKIKRDVSAVPKYYALYAVAFLLYGLGFLSILGGIITLFIPPSEYELYGQMYTMSYAGAGFAAIASGIGMVVAGEIWRVFRDMARNTAATTMLLQRLVDKDN